jgi:hypothetical protein
MAKKGIAIGADVLLRAPVVATWPDGRITVMIGGQRVTIQADDDQIVEVEAERKERSRKLFDKPDA